MSVESAKEFLAKMKSDEAYAQSVVEAASRDERAALVKEQGFEFSKEDLDTAAMGFSGEGELDEDELDGVAGGAAVSGGGNRFFDMARKSLGSSSIASAGSFGRGGFQCDSSGSEGECVC